MSVSFEHIQGHSRTNEGSLLTAVDTMIELHSKRANAKSGATTHYIQYMQVIFYM